MTNFTVKNAFYSYTRLSSRTVYSADTFLVLFAYSGYCEVSFGTTHIALRSGQFITLLAPSETIVDCLSNDSAILVLSRLISDNPCYQIPSKPSSVVDDAYKVSKPWGHEYWLSGVDPLYNSVLKSIYVKKGTKTSLQVHLKKMESNYLVSGQAIFRTSHIPFKGKDVDYPLNSDIIDRPTCIDVKPLTIHQLEALTDLYLVEASTNHLDDVIRLQDDCGRGDGRIDSEHQMKDRI